jgi:hypothetical protein
MSNAFPTIRQLPRDGTSQRARRPEALDPGGALLDGRELADQLAYLRGLARLLRWYDESDTPAGTWERLIRDDTHLAALLAYAEDPTRLPGDLASRVSPPHLTLLVVVLRLLERARIRLNRLPARHLDFYYREILGLEPRPPRPDRVHCLVSLAPGRRAAQLPEGTLLSAGPDASGKERLYATEHALIVSRARVAELRSLFAEVLVRGPSAVRRDRNRTPAQRFIELLTLAIGDPGPGDPLPARPGWPAVDDPFITATLGAWIGFCASDLHLELFELRELVALVRERNRDQAQWRAINSALNAIGSRRTGGAFDLVARLGANFDQRAFARNLREALGRESDFSGLPEVDDIDDLYRQRDRDDVRTFIDAAPYSALAAPLAGDHPPGPIPRELADDFLEMMAMKQAIDAQWAAIRALLELAGQRHRDDPSYRLDTPPGPAPASFATALIQALPGLDFAALPRIGARRPISDIDAYLRQIEEIEDYFLCSAESFRFLVEQTRPALADPAALAPRLVSERTDAILAEARLRKSVIQRTDALRERRTAEAKPEQGLAAMLRAALARPPTDQTSLATLVDETAVLLGTPSDESDESDLRTLADAITAGRRILAGDWQRLETIAECAERARLGDQAAPIERRIWLALQASTDATSVHPPALHEATDETRVWRTFGQAALDPRPDDPPEPILGWALTSPVLALRQGRRRIRLWLQFASATLTPEQVAAIRALIPAPDAPPGSGPFEIRVSAENTWLAADIETLSLPADSGEWRNPEAPFEGGAPDGRLILGIRLDYSSAAPAIQPPTEEMGLLADWPVLRLRLLPHWDGDLGRFVVPYPELRILRILAWACEVEVGDPSGADSEAGLTPAAIRSDVALLAADKPFQPFGPRPSVGSRLAIADPELAVKRLDRVRFDLEWLGLPDTDLGNHYQGYNRHTAINNAAFKVQVSVVDRRTPVAIGAPLALFHGSDASRPWHLVVNGVDAALGQPPASNDTRRPKDAGAWSRHLRWELTPLDFQHPVYPSEAAAAAAVAAASGDDPKVLNPPYTPELKQLSIGYRAQARWDPLHGRAADAGEALLHLHPFGHSRFAQIPSQGLPFLPAYDAAGELLIGLDGLEAPQRLSLLFQMAEGTADPDLPPAAVDWSYLDGQDWVPLAQGRIRRDQTRGLINSGIVELDLPAAPIGPRLPAGHYWLRLAVAEHPRSVCDMVAIAAQGVSARFADRGNDPGHYAEPLPAGSITRTARPVSGIAGIAQPYTSFGGRPAESDEALITRAGERLRHRARAVTTWDYERLVLECFPQIYKAKCTFPRIAEGAAPGDLDLVVIPDVTRLQPSDPYAPKAPANLIARIRDDLQARAPLCAQVRVRNATFVPVRIRIAIRFHDAFDVDLAKADLNEALNRYLSPWAFDEGAEIFIGGSVYANTIVDFVERRASVDYVERIRLFRLDLDNGIFEPIPPPGDPAADGYHVAAGGQDRVLVAARRHDIDVILPGVASVAGEEAKRGIGYMKIGLDFVVNETAAAEAA